MERDPNHLLRKHGYDCASCENGKEGPESNAQSPDLHTHFLDSIKENANLANPCYLWMITYTKFNVR